MARVRAKARIVEITTTAGNGPYTLGGAVDGSYNTFASFCANGDTIKVTVIEPGTAFWTGVATFNTGPNRITLTTVEETKGTFGAGTKEVCAGPLASSDPSPLPIVVGTGSATACALSTAWPADSNLDGFTVSFTPGASNTGAVTLAVDGGSARPLRFLTGVDLPANVLISGSLYQATYRAASGEWLLHAFNAAAFSIPIGGIIDFAGALAPNGSFALPQGQGLSAAAYPFLFSLIGYTFGGSGSTFNLPDLTGRVVAMRESSPARLTSSYFGGNSTLIGAAGGREYETLSIGNIASFTPTGVFSASLASGNAAITMRLYSGTTGFADTSHVSSGNNAGADAGSFNAPVSGSVSGSVLMDELGSNTPHNNTQPTMILNKLMRVL